ncbi:hypothetical protein CBW24_16095 (plasmid) [Pacificitalea manganoxidans]|jgi:TRAP-type C4-dicarboxylate transport system substrate-binding protein|uniref:TRAP-type C4-dicarboxylate transport system substrate-binding protein n=1 Tax=Pacificitalea manganoxidans TaxID=1411902 RepID=A0A291M4A4_9RHOB|nr:TRAP transporter substrate-binding protein DctP [Pacificitalea manganoxidans]ATI43677.1 hypothetical protein CBW24_16095 [Pacificitalea manganoxidans]MDR6310071.1 TRAP-type C4-dicarboxylate transport system substrate-binding protein [Pacificitalea manganoxidans]
MKHLAKRKLVLACAFAVAATTATAQDTIDMKVSYNQPASSAAWQDVMQSFVDELEEKSEGRIKITTYPGEVLHSVGDGFKAAASGITDLTSAWPIYLTNSFELFHATQLPLALPDSNVAAVRVIDELYPKYFKAEYEKLGIKLAFNAATPQYDILTTKPVESLADLKGLKLRATGGGLTEIVERLGAVPVSMTISDAYTAFQQGVVDGIILATADMVAYRLHEVGKYNYRLGVTRVAIPQAVNRKFYEDLPDDLKMVLSEASANASVNYSEMYNRLTDKALETMEAEGITTTVASDDDIATANELLAPMWDNFVAANEGNSTASAEVLTADMRALTEKFSAMSDEEIKALPPVEGLR